MRHALRWTVLLSFVPAGVAAAEPLPAGAWLVDLGRDYPRTVQAGVSDADAEITLLFMEAAGRIDPSLAEPFLWQYDMLTALDRPEAAHEALTTYVRLQPDNIAAHLDWLAMEIDQLQTAEARAEFCRTHLQQRRLPDNVASDLHRRLADFHLGRGERDQAAAEAKAAIEAYDLNFRARRLLERLESPGTPRPPQADLEHLLLALSACPNDPVLAAETADLLMTLNLPEPAEQLYTHAVMVLKLFDPESELALAMTDRAVALQAMGREKEARDQIEKADREWQALLADRQGQLEPDLAGHMAWFYAFHNPRPEQAERLARVALVEDPELIVAQRALGSALRQLNRLDEAKSQLEPIADMDAAAAAEYAQVLVAQGKDPLARETLTRATTRPAVPEGQLAMARASRQIGLAPPTSRPAPEEATQALERFRWGVLDYPLRPDKHLSLSLMMPRPEIRPGEPWLLTARLTNTGRFPITIGPGMMVSPDLLVAVHTEGDRPRTTGPTLQFSFNRTPRLMPGESVEIAHTVDLGVIRSGMIGTPQMTHEVTVSGILSPISFLDGEGQEVVAPAIGGQMSQAKFRRAAFSPSGENMSELAARLRSDDPLGRIAAMELLAMLLAEHQHLQAGRLKYSARAVDAPAVQRTVMGMSTDRDWHVRARLVECLRWLSLDPAVRDTANILLRDSHWLVRGLTMRAMTDHYGIRFQSVLNQAAEGDPDEWVRRFASALNARITAAAASDATDATKNSPR